MVLLPALLNFGCPSVDVSPVCAPVLRSAPGGRAVPVPRADGAHVHVALHQFDPHAPNGLGTEVGRTEALYVSAEQPGQQRASFRRPILYAFRFEDSAAAVGRSSVTLPPSASGAGSLASSGVEPPNLPDPASVAGALGIVGETLVPALNALEDAQRGPLFLCVLYARPQYNASSHRVGDGPSAVALGAAAMTMGQLMRARPFGLAPLPTSRHGSAQNIRDASVLSSCGLNVSAASADKHNVAAGKGSVTTPRKCAIDVPLFNLEALAAAVSRKRGRDGEISSSWRGIASRLAVGTLRICASVFEGPTLRDSVSFHLAATGLHRSSRIRTATNPYMIAAFVGDGALRPSCDVRTQTAPAASVFHEPPFTTDATNTTLAEAALAGALTTATMQHCHLLALAEAATRVSVGFGAASGNGPLPLSGGIARGRLEAWTDSTFGVTGGQLQPRFGLTLGVGAAIGEAAEKALRRIALLRDTLPAWRNTGGRGRHVDDDDHGAEIEFDDLCRPPSAELDDASRNFFSGAVFRRVSSAVGTSFRASGGSTGQAAVTAQEAYALACAAAAGGAANESVAKSEDSTYSVDVYRSNTLAETLNPTWEPSPPIPLAALVSSGGGADAAVIRLSCRDHDAVFSDEIIGAAQVSLLDMREAAIAGTPIELKKSHKSHGSYGELYVRRLRIHRYASLQRLLSMEGLQLRVMIGIDFQQPPPTLTRGQRNEQLMDVRGCQTAAKTADAATTLSCFETALAGTVAALAPFATVPPPPPPALAPPPLQRPATALYGLHGSATGCARRDVFPLAEVFLPVLQPSTTLSSDGAPSRDLAPLTFADAARPSLDPERLTLDAYLGDGTAPSVVTDVIDGMRSPFVIGATSAVDVYRRALSLLRPEAPPASGAAFDTLILHAARTASLGFSRWAHAVPGRAAALRAAVGVTLEPDHGGTSTTELVLDGDDDAESWLSVSMDGTAPMTNAPAQMVKGDAWLSGALHHVTGIAGDGSATLPFVTLFIYTPFDITSDAEADRVRSALAACVSFPVAIVFVAVANAALVGAEQSQGILRGIASGTFVAGRRHVPSLHTFPAASGPPSSSLESAVLNCDLQRHLLATYFPRLQRLVAFAATELPRCVCALDCVAEYNPLALVRSAPPAPAAAGMAWAVAAAMRRIMRRVGTIAVQFAALRNVGISVDDVFGADYHPDRAGPAASATRAAADKRWAGDAVPKAETLQSPSVVDTVRQRLHKDDPRGTRPFSGVTTNTRAATRIPSTRHASGTGSPQSLRPEAQRGGAPGADLTALMALLDSPDEGVDDDSDDEFISELRRLSQPAAQTSDLDDTRLLELLLDEKAPHDLEDLI